MLNIFAPPFCLYVLFLYLRDLRSVFFHLEPPDCDFLYLPWRGPNLSFV